MKRLINNLFDRKNWIYFVLLAFSLTPLIWFLNRSGFLVNGIDTNFPLDPVVWLSRRFYLWNSIPNGGIDHSSSVSGIFFHLIQVIPYLVGVNLQGVQIVSFVFWFSVIVFGSFWLAKILFKENTFVQILFVVFYTFNIYAFNAWENSKVSTLSLLASVPIFLSIITLYLQQKIDTKLTITLSIVGGIIASGTGVNPAYLMSLFLIVFFYTIGFLLSDFSKANFFRAVKGYFLILVATLLINSFWVIPTASYIFENISSNRSIDKIGFTNWVDSLSEHTSILNVMRLQGLWDWYAFDSVSGTPLYIPYALNYFKSFPFIIFSFLIPALVLTSFVFFEKKQKALYISFGIMALLGIFLGAGTHLPTGSIYRLLLDKIPFFSLFRSPWYIFTPLVIISFTGLLALLFENLRVAKPIKTFLTLVLIVGNLFYSYPLLTGKIFRPSKPDGFYVKFPNYVLDFKEKLKTNQKDGRIVGYPDDEIEQFEWGYRGIESILTLFSDQEVVFSPLNNLNSPIVDITRMFYVSLKKGQFKATTSLASKLNISNLFEKLDQRSLSSKLTDEIKSKNLISSQQWNLFEINSSNQGKIFSPDSYYSSYPYTRNPKPLAVLSPSSVVINSDDSVVKDLPSIVSESGVVITTENSQAKDFENMNYGLSNLASRLTSRDLSKVEFTFEVLRDSAYKPVLEKYSLNSFGINANNLLATLDGVPVQFVMSDEDDTFIYFEPIKLGIGHHKLIINLNNKNLAPNSTFSDLNGFERLGVADFRILNENGQNFLSITNTSGNDAHANFSISDFDPLNPYLVQANYKQIYGNNGLSLITQNTNQTLVKTQTERLPNYPEWKSFSFFYEPVKTNSEAFVHLTSPETKDPLGTKVFYDNLEIYKVFMNDLFLVSEGVVKNTPTINFTQKSPVFYQGEVTGGGDHMIVFNENYSLGWEMTMKNENGKIISGNLPHFSTNLYANAWYIESPPSNYTFEIYYKPQRLLNLGFIVSGFSILGLVGYWIYDKKYHRHAKTTK